MQNWLNDEKINDENDEIDKIDGIDWILDLERIWYLLCWPTLQVFYLKGRWTTTYLYILLFVTLITI